MSKIPFEEIERRAQSLGRAIDAQTPPDVGFMLWLFDYGLRGNMTYVASTNREDAIRTVEEWLKVQQMRGFTDFDIAEFCWCCGSKDIAVTFSGKHRYVNLCTECYTSCENIP